MRSHATPLPSATIGIVALIEGAAMLALELAGARLLTPLFGQSLALWTNLITVTLASLAVGYALGAYLSRRHPASRLLGCLVVASLHAFAVGCFPGVLLGRLSAEPGNVRMAMAAWVTLGPSLIGLGASGPLLVEASDARVTAGRRVGWIFAVSTLGSLLAAPLTGLVLLPQIGTRQVFVGVAFLLGAAASAVGLVRNFRISAVMIFIVSTLFIIYYNIITNVIHDISVWRVLGHWRSANGDVVVIQSRGEDDEPIRRVLLVDGHVQNAIDARTGQPPRESYLKAIRQLAGLGPGDRAVVLGLGAGVLPMAWAHDGVDVVAVEPNPAVATAAIEHFGLDREQVRIERLDGRRFLQRESPACDVIVVDAFVGATVPVHLYTVEALREASARLTPEGLWIAWVLDAPGPPRVAVWPRVACTAAQVFPDVMVWRQRAAGAMVGHLVLASRTGAFVPTAPEGFQRVPVGELRSAIMACAPQTDNRADLDLAGGRLNAAAHRAVRLHIGDAIHEWFLR